MLFCVTLYIQVRQCHNNPECYIKMVRGALMVDAVTTLWYVHHLSRFVIEFILVSRKPFLLLAMPIFTYSSLFFVTSKAKSILKDTNFAMVWVGSLQR